MIFGGRPSPLGNPCSIPAKPCPVCGVVHFGPGMVQLTPCRSCSCYRKWLWGKMKVQDQVVMQALRAIKEDSILGCFCTELKGDLIMTSPEVCHLQVVCKAVRHLRKE